MSGGVLSCHPNGSVQLENMHIAIPDGFAHHSRAGGHKESI